MKLEIEDAIRFCKEGRVILTANWLICDPDWSIDEWKTQAQSFEDSGFFRLISIAAIKATE
jgi:hypothetical protein